MSQLNDRCKLYINICERRPDRVWFFLIMKFVFVKSLDQIYFKIKINNNNHETVLF